MNRSRSLIILVVLLIIVSSPLPAESAFSGTRVWVSYLGELGTHQGVAIGAQFPLVASERYELSAGPVLGFYVHPRNHIGLYLDAELENRFVFPSGLFLTIGANAGYFHSWLSGDGVYVRDGAGDIARTADWGRPYAKTGGSLGVGWDFARSQTAPILVFTRLDLFARYPFNDSVLPQAALLAGAAYQTGGEE